MKKKIIIKFILLNILSICLLYETLYLYNNSDPWGLTFAFGTIPLAILSVIAIYNTIKTLKLIIKNNKNDMKCRTFKPIYFLPIIIILILLTGLIMYNSFYSQIKSYKIPQNYIAIFNGGSGEVTYSTYIYKINNGNANYGFEYINTTNTTTSWGSPNRNIKINSKGTVSWTDDVFTIAKNNNAYSYVKLPNDNKNYTIDEFMSMFLMN